jgi:RNA-directed DNA polymerase
MSQGKYLDLSLDSRTELLDRWELPILRTPQELADWLRIPLGKLAWLSGRFAESGRPVDPSRAHYRYSWKAKRRGGYRLIEAPLPLLRQVQEQILDEILSRVPVHPAAHGFCAGRSILTNARPHVNQDVVIGLDLDNFYSRVRYSRVVAVFRGLGYSREAALWLSRLTTSAIPNNLEFPGGDPKLLRRFLPRHLPQGAPTSPALANLVAYGLDVRLSGMARSFQARYTRYGDDLTFSGSWELGACSRLFLPLVLRIIREERFRVNSDKRRFLRRSTRQQVTGVVVNEKPNISRQCWFSLAINSQPE